MDDLVKRSEHYIALMNEIGESHCAETMQGILTRIAELEAALKESREALAPFASAAQNYSDNPATDYNIVCGDAFHPRHGIKGDFTLGDLRRAARALAAAPAGDKP